MTWQAKIRYTNYPTPRHILGGAFHPVKRLWDIGVGATDNMEYYSVIINALRPALAVLFMLSATLELRLIFPALLRLCEVNVDSCIGL